MISGNNITANNYYGIYLDDSSSFNSMSGNDITNNSEDGIVLYDSSNYNSMSGNNITNNSYYGIRLGSSSNYNSIIGNNITNNWPAGILLHDSSSFNSIIGNNITNNSDYCIWLYDSKNNSINGNKLTDGGLAVWDSYSNSVENNTVNGRPLVYLEGVADYSVDDAGQVVLVRCDRIRVEDLNLSRTSNGVQLWETNNSIISGNKITANTVYGVELFSSSNNSMSGNDITNNSGNGISLDSSSNHNSINRNNITNNSVWGILLSDSSSFNSINGNNITNNSWDGIWLYSSSNYNSIIGNNITNNSDYGVGLYDSSNYNSIIGNNITNNGFYGVYLDSSSNNKFYHNNFIYNGVQVYSEDSANVWDDGYPSGGNYWSDYFGVDIKSGPGQDLPGSDGIGDTPYVIDANNVDHYPLMSTYGAPPLPTYTLTITTTVGGTTDPAPGTYSYTANSTVQVTAIPEANYLFDYWELDGVNVGSANPYSVLMDKNHTLKAVFSLIPPPLSASISPLSASILAGQSVTFTPTVSGGYTPYSYQWYLNGAPVSEATSNTWTFTPTTSGIYYVHLKVTDDKGNTAQSETARITVATVPVGGYSIPIQVHTKTEPIIPYIALIATLTAVFTKLRPKTKRKR
jgi:parallel beta-helix repeat protein